ncbi:response regulator transcription factor [Marinicella gelatinilytica]|uniref:response regulator transcription factor n=1 Tax=Marinicella gelatinilytica TaxID=2996017 RepID=UPI0022608465|nr:response regulator transcription factor [Marinicella gelatinilytica]MCX7544655.1 response regulator transcription factor [Marinicella gelatinilytica]
MNEKIKILIAEDQSMLLGALAALLNLEDDFEVVAQAKNGQEALDKVRQYQPDLVLTDIEMPTMTGIELAQEIKNQDLPCEVIVLTTFARAGFLKRAMAAGVKGYMLKDTPSEELATAIRTVMKGGKVIDPELVMETWHDMDPLTDKERRALQLVADGLSTDKIAARLFLSPGTVRNYLSNAVSKLGAHNSIEAARIARQKGWL